VLKEIKVISKPVVETDFAELPDGTLLDTIEDPNNSAKTLLAVYRDKSVHYTDRIEADDRICVPISRSTAILNHVRFSRGAKPYESTAHLLAALYALFSWCLDMPSLQAVLLSCFVLSTCLLEKLPVAPYVAFVGLPRSGKTTALRLLSLLCRRSLLTSDITSASFYDACNHVTPTILIDETATAGDRRALFHLLRAGSTKGSVAIRRNKVYSAYCPKVVCWTQLPEDAALNSRCIIIPLQETDRRNLLRPTDPKVLAHADAVRQMLQQYRFENFNRLSLERVPGDEYLNSRSRDLYEALALPIGDANIREFLAVQFQLQQNFNREPLSPTAIAVLKALDSHIHDNLTDATYAHGRLTDGVNLILEDDRELFHASPHQVGHVLTSFGLTERKRMNTGWFLLLSRDMREKIHKLVRRHGLEVGGSVSRDNCEFCTGQMNAPHGAVESAAGLEKTPLSDGPEASAGSEHSELRALKTE
jgi:hypothetical protein